MDTMGLDIQDLERNTVKNHAVVKPELFTILCHV